MHSPAVTTALRLLAAILFPLALGASGCCGCPVGLCSSIFSTPSVPPPPIAPLPPGLLGAGGGAGAGGGSGTSGVDAPLIPVPALPPRVALPITSKSFHEYLDKTSPIRGALIEKLGGTKHFVPHAAHNVASLGDGRYFVVASSTGLWLHDSATLEKRFRLVDEPVGDVAAAPNGARLAYSLENGDIRVVAFPNYAKVAELDTFKAYRMRFSLDGSRLAVAPGFTDVLLFPVRSGALAKTVDAGEFVKDVFPLPDDPTQIAYASPSNEVATIDVETGKHVFRSTPLFEAQRTKKNGSFRMGAQYAVAYDSLTKTLLSGGNDERLWRITDFRGQPKLEKPLDLGGNVQEIACCAGSTVTDRAVYVALESVRVRAVALDGRFGPELGPLVPESDSVEERIKAGSRPPTRIAILPSGEVLVIALHGLLRWNPRTGKVLQSAEYAPTLPPVSSLEDDTVFVACANSTCAVHRVEHDGAATEVETTVLGEVSGTSVASIPSFDAGLRAIVLNHEDKLRIVYLPRLGMPEAPLDTAAQAGGRFAPRDGSTHGYLDPSGDVYEIVANPRGIRKVGSVKAKRGFSYFNWDQKKERYLIWRIGEPDAFVP